MLRKCVSLLAVLAVVGLAGASFSTAQDEESPAHKLMEKVGDKGNAIKRAIRSTVQYKKSQAELPKLATDMITLAKQAKDMKEPAAKEKKSYAEWQKLCDDWIKETEKFKDLVSKSTTAQDAAKKSYNAVNTACTDCHKVFRIDDEK